MILEEIQVTNWRKFREPQAFKFKDGVNLLVGRNEAGKSTLFEALTRAFFDRYNSKNDEIKAMQPIGSSLGPEVKIQFQSNGTRYMSVKRFIQNPQSQLFSERNGKWELNHEGDKADAYMRELLQGETAQRTEARPEHRGIAQALWYLQTDGSIPVTAWNEGVKQGLQGLVKIAATSPRERKILEGIEKVYNEYWTPKGRLTSNSELANLQVEIPILVENLTTIREKARIVDSYRTDLEEYCDEESLKKLELGKAENELIELTKLVQAAEIVEKEKESKEKAKKEAFERRQKLKQDIEQIQGRQSKVIELKNEFKKLNESLTEIGTDAKLEATASERHARCWKEELEPILKHLEDELRALHAVANLRKLEKEQDRLKEHGQKIIQIRSQLEDRKKERSGILSPDIQEWKKFTKASVDLNIVTAKVESSAVRVKFEWDDTKKKITTRPPLKESGKGEFIVAEATEFIVQGVGKIHIRSGAQDLKDLLSEQAQLNQDLDKILQRFHVKDKDGLATLYEKGRDLDQAITKLDENLQEIEKREPDWEEELSRTERGIEEETRAAGELASEALKQGGRSIREQIAKKESEKEGLIRRIKGEQELAEAAGKKNLDLLKKQGIISSTIAERNAQIGMHEENITEILQAYGTINHLKELVIKADEELAIAQTLLEGLLQDYEKKVDTPRKLYSQCQDRVKELEGQINDLRTKVISTMARIEESAAQGNYGQLADLEIDVEQKRKRVEVLQRRANGVKLLHDIVAIHEKQRSAALSGPVQDLTNRWLGLLTDSDYDLLRIDELIRPAGVHMTRYNEDLPLTSLSYGAKEQIIVLLRLAIGVLISKDSQNLVVIDDHLVNADPVRMKRLCLILQEASKTCQIIIATCNGTPYAGLKAHYVRVPADKT